MRNRNPQKRWTPQLTFSTNGDGMRFFLLVLLFVLASLAFAQDECFDLCSSCMNNDKQDVCAKVESLCKCSKILESLKQELLTNSSSSADTVQVDQAVPDTNTQQTDSLAKADSSIHNDSAIMVVTTQDTQVVEKRQVPSLGEQNINVTISVVTEKEKAEEKKDRIFYFGISLGFEQFQEKTVANYEVEEAEDYIDHLGANLGFFLRWYFYRAGSFQFGLNAIYHHGYYYIEESDYRIGRGQYNYNHDISIDYHSFMAEIPLTFRFGIPLIISPYLSLDFHVRKPIFARIDYDVFVNVQLGDYYDYNNRDFRYDDYGSNEGTFANSDWEFLGYLGFGFEFTRHISIQWQMLLLDAVTYSAEMVNYKLLADTWRISLDIAF